jgi:hypothetical protein
MDEILRARTAALPSLSVVRRTVDEERYRQVLAHELVVHRPLYEMLLSRPAELYETVADPPASVPWGAVQAGECGSEELERWVREMREFVHPPLRSDRDRGLYRTATGRMLGYEYGGGATLTLAQAVERAREEAGARDAKVRGALLARARELSGQGDRAHRRA